MNRSLQTANLDPNRNSRRDHQNLRMGLSLWTFDFRHVVRFVHHLIVVCGLCLWVCFKSYTQPSRHWPSYSVFAPDQILSAERWVSHYVLTPPSLSLSHQLCLGGGGGWGGGQYQYEKRSRSFKVLPVRAGPPSLPFVCFHTCERETARAWL